jgi:hypothetical protein
MNQYDVTFAIRWYQTFPHGTFPRHALVAPATSIGKPKCFQEGTEDPARATESKNNMRLAKDFVSLTPLLETNYH